MSKVYEFDARTSRLKNIYDEQVTCYFGLLFADRSGNIITETKPKEIFNNRHCIGKITQISLTTDICDGRGVSTFRLELDNSNPMGKFAEYLLDNLFETYNCKTGESGIAKNIIIASAIYGNIYDNVLFLKFFGAVFPTVLEDYYEIIYTDKYTERDRKYMEGKYNV